MMHYRSLPAVLISASMIIIPSVSAELSFDPPVDPAAQPDSRNTTRPGQPDRTSDHNRTNSDLVRDKAAANRDGEWKYAQPGEMHNWLEKLSGSWDIAVENHQPTAWRNQPATGTNGTDNTRVNAGSAEKSTGTAKTEMVLDGRYAHMMVKGSGKQFEKDADRKDASSTNRTIKNADGTTRAADQSDGFEGMQLIGYNNQTQRFESIWTDNQCTGVTVLTGDLDADRKVLTLTNDSVVIDTARTNGMNTTTNSNTVKGSSPGSTKGKVRQVIRWTGPSTFVTEVYKTGESGSEDKQMVITFTKRDASSMGAAPTTP